MKLFYPANWLLVMLTVILLVFSDNIHSQTPLSFTAIPYSETDLNAPGRGVEQWHNGNEVNVPSATTSTTRLDKYYRFSWNHFETTQGNYTWTQFDGQINNAISNGQKFSFGVMTCCPGCEGGWTVTYGGASSAYPQYLHNLMQAESVKDWNSGGTWVPNYNSETYLSRLLALNQAIYNHIQNTSYNGVRYRDVVSIIDIRGYGSWGEWHSGSIVDNNVNEYPAGTFPTVATLKRIVDAHTQGFPDIPLVAMIAAFDANYLGIVMNPPEIGHYILTTKNNWGPIGWRRDQWGATDSYLESYLVNNTRSFNGVPLNSLIMERWKTSPITGEPPGWATDYNILESQIRLYHASSFGNGNYGGADPNSIGNNIRASSKAAGYRLVLEGGSLNSAITTGTSTPVTLNWKNVGIAPTYENWDVVFELKNSGGTTVWSGKSSFKLKLFLPQTNNTAVTDNLTIPTSVAAGTYSLNLIVKDPNGYRKPLPLAIRGVNADGSYTLRSVTVSTGTGQANNPPVAAAGADRAITLPTNSASLAGSGTDGDGTIASYLWEQLSGPSSSTLSATNAANITVSNLETGTYTYRLTVTDDDGATDTDDVVVTVANGAISNQAPVANAGANKTITLPTNSTTLSGSGSSDPDGTIAGYQWQQVSGPSTSTLSATNSVNITVSNLQAGTYTYRLTVTDNSDASDNVTVTVIVNNAAANQAPVANAGPNRTITLPTSSANLAGSGTDADGTISGYQWLQVSGPSNSTLSVTNTANIAVSNLQAGVYTYRLTVTDNGAATGTDEVTVTVNDAPNQAPVAAAGANRTITLPTNSTSLSGSGSIDADGTISSYRWQQVNGPSTSTFSATNTANITISNLQAGVYTYRITVTDNNGATDTDDVTVTVNSASNLPPSANAGANKSLTLPNSSTTLSGSGTDPDGTIAAYQWQQVSGPAASALSANNVANITINNLQAGVYTYRLTVRDNAGATSTDDVSVTVNTAPNQAPVANAGTNKSITLPTSSTTLTGNGTDADGTIAAYQWQQVSGPSASTLSATNTAGITVSNLQAGVYTYRLTVTDNDGAADTDDVTVTASNAPANQAPNANAGANRSITLPTNSTTLNGNGNDADGTIASYLWQQVSGPSASTLSATNTADITVSNLQAGVYSYRLTVTDNDGATDVDLVNVTVNGAPKKAPNANAGSNKSVTLPTSSTSLSGTASADEDGTIVNYQWQQVSGPSTSTLTSANAANTDITNLQNGVYTYRLTVTDNDNTSDADLVTVTVNIAPNQAPVANAGANRVITLPTNSTSLNGSASGDADGTISSYQWQQVSGPSTAALSAANTASITVSNLVAGAYTFRLTVTDNDNATATDEVTVTVNNQPNEAPIANAGTNLIITLPTNSASLTGGGIDADGTIAGYQWQQISGPSASTLSATTTANITVTNLQAGVYIYRLTLRDDDNATGTDNVTITVNSAPPNQAPFADAGANRIVTLPTNTASLSGSASTDADGTITSYLWQLVSGPSTPALSATNTVNVTVRNLQAGVYTYQLTVRDNDNATSVATVTVTVNASTNTLPIADAGTDQTIVVTANTTTLDAGQSIDPDGTITNYTWQQVSGPGASVFSATSGKTVDVSNLLVGEYTYRLTVRDNKNATATAIVRVTVIDNFRNYTTSVVVYPNPATEVINIRLLNDKPGRVQVNIYDMSGKVVLSPLMVNKPAGAYSVPVTVSLLKPGTYVVQITTFGFKKIAATFIKL